MQIDAYLKRIGFDGPLRADLATLRALHRAHQLAVPFENIDVQLGRTLSTDPKDAYAKIVERNRGGWCYEMNGLFGWALEAIGFDVTRLAAGVMREQAGDAQLGNHLCLLVRLLQSDLGQPYLVDVGFGGSLLEPLPLRAVTRVDAPYSVALSEAEDTYWRFTEKASSNPFSFDFRTDPADEALLAAKCDYLQTNDASPFVQNLVVQRRSVDSHIALRGRVVTVTQSNGVQKSVLQSADELVDTLNCHFNLNIPESASLWPAICARHAALFPE